MNATKWFYALIFGVIAITPHITAIEPIFQQPHNALIEHLKANGHRRIAQGVQSVIAQNPDTKEVFHHRSILMLTLNDQNGNTGICEWTVSVLNNTKTGSILLAGTHLRKASSNSPRELTYFDREKAQIGIERFSGFAPAYYPDEVVRQCEEFGYQRLYTGIFKETTHWKLQKLAPYAFIDLLYKSSNGDFKILLCDKYGACAKIAFGGTFSEID